MSNALHSQTLSNFEVSAHQDVKEGFGKSMTTGQNNGRVQEGEGEQKKQESRPTVSRNEATINTARARPGAAEGVLVHGLS